MGKGVRVRVCVCVCERVRKGFCGPRKECVFGKGTCSLSDTEGKAKVFAFVSMGPLTEKRTLRGGGALQFLDLRLLEDGGERGGALGSDLVSRDTASDGQDGNGERVGVSMGADTKANTQELVREAGGLLERLQCRVALETLCNRGSSFRTELVVLETAGGGVGDGW